VLTSTYGAVGAEIDLLGRGLIPAGILHPYKARVLLMTALAAGLDRDAITAAFASYS
jgi:L-asparaginase